MSIKKRKKNQEKEDEVRRRRRKKKEEEEEKIDEVKMKDQGEGGVKVGGGITEKGEVTDLTHAQLEGASLLFELLCNFSSTHLGPHHPILTS